MKPAVLPKKEGRPRNLDPCLERLRIRLAEKMLRSPLSVPCCLFVCEDNTSASNSDLSVQCNVLYNAGAWDLTVSETETLDVFNRKQLRSLIGIHWPQRISNVKLYERCRRDDSSATPYAWTRRRPQTDPGPASPAPLTPICSRSACG